MTHWILGALGFAVVLGAIATSGYVMLTNRLPFVRRATLSHGCPQCECRFRSEIDALMHEITDHAE